MTIMIELTPEQEAQLRVEAGKRRMDETECARTLLAEKLTPETESGKPRQRSILELEGVGAELWKDIDVEKYINDSRDEWDRRP